MSRTASFDIDSVVVGVSAHMRSLFDALPVISAGDTPLLLVGEAGTGKELVARLIHQSSERRRGPFVPVSCAGLAAPALEAELFGYERGAFAGASRARTGRFERAAHGTILLDDIDEAPASVQVKLIRVLHDRRCERLGGSSAATLDVRVIAATTRDLRTLVEQGRLRDDLVRRLDVLTLHLPPLRDRREDILALMHHFVARAARRRGGEPPAVAPHVEHAFLTYDWPGNVRELENVCERIAQTCTCGTVRTGCVAPAVLFDGGSAGAQPLPAFDPPRGISLDDRLREVEAQLIGWALRAADGNKSRAAELLRIKRTTLTDRISRHRGRRLRYADGQADETAGSTGPVPV